MSIRKKKIYVIASIIGATSTFLISVVFLVVHIENARRFDRYMAKCGQLTFLHSLVYPLLIGTEVKTKSLSESLNNNHFLPLKPNMWCPQNEEIVSWRKWVLDFGYYIQWPYNVVAGGDDANAMMIYCASGHCENGQTNFVFITGEKTIHHFDRDKVMNIIDSKFDKILLVEYPSDQIPWDSLQDISVTDVCALWRKTKKTNFGLRNEIAYITLRGRYGSLSCFATEKDLMNMLILTDIEIEKFNTSNPE